MLRKPLPCPSAEVLSSQTSSPKQNGRPSLDARKKSNGKLAGQLTETITRANNSIVIQAVQGSDSRALAHLQGGLSVEHLPIVVDLQRLQALARGVALARQAGVLVHLRERKVALD